MLFTSRHVRSSQNIQNAVKIKNAESINKSNVWFVEQELSLLTTTPYDLYVKKITQNKLRYKKANIKKPVNKVKNIYILNYQFFFLSTKLRIILSKFSVKLSNEKFSMTLSCPVLPISLLKCLSRTKLAIASANSRLSCGHRKPVLLLITVSFGPPELTAMTGVPQYIASSGTMPKCSP